MPHTERADVGATSSASRDESFIRLVEQMRQYFSLADFLPVGVEGTSGVNELTGSHPHANGVAGSHS
jgi:hypothetical protein